MFIGKQMEILQGFNEILFLKYNECIRSVKLFKGRTKKPNLLR